MEILLIRNHTLLSDGRVKKEVRLSSPVTKDVLTRLSHGQYVSTGYQYLSPTYAIIRPKGYEISGILHSPVITLICPPSLSAGVEDFLTGFLSTIPDSNTPESRISFLFQTLKSFLAVKMFYLIPRR